MKGGFRLHGLRREKLSLISIVIVSTTILILSWEKTPSLTGLIPPYPEMLIPSDILPIWLDEDAEDLLEDGEINGVPILSSLTKSQTKKNGVEEEKTLEEVEYRTDFVIDSPENGPLINGDANIGNNATEIEEIISSLSDEEAKDLPEDGEVHGIPALSGQTKTKAKTNKENGEKTAELEKQGTDFVMDSPENRSLISGGDTNNGNNATENEEILSSLSDEEAKDLLEDGGSHRVPTLPSQAKTEAKGNEPDGEKTLKKEQRTEFVMDSPQDRSLISLEDANNGNNATENEEILSSLSDEEAQDLLEDGEIHGSSTLSSLTNIETADGNRSTIRGKDANNWNDATENEVCNYAKGKWVPDNLRPLYSGFGCKQWLSAAWACRLTRRTDFEYENLRWQPKDCQMEEFEGSKFLRRLQNKTLAFVGDSLGRQQFQSLMCMITGDEETHDVEDVGSEYGLVTPDGASRPHGWAFRFLSPNTTILYYWSSTLCHTEPIDANNPETGYAMHLDRPTSFLKEYLHKFDVLVLNTGHHWNRGKLKAHRWVMHIGGVPSTDKKLAVIWRAKNITVHSVVSWVNSQLPKYPGLKVFYRTISPRHFVGGDWDTGGSCNNTKPMSVGKEILIEEPIDRTAANAVQGTRVKLLDITALSQLRDEGHISRFRINADPGVQDCLHWCLPGVPDTWNEILFAQI